MLGTATHNQIVHTLVAHMSIIAPSAAKALPLSTSVIRLYFAHTTLVLTVQPFIHSWHHPSKDNQASSLCSQLMLFILLLD